MWRVFVIAVLWPTLCFAQGPDATVAGVFVPMQGVEYYCTDKNGARRELGEVMCVNASSCQQFLAKCDMSQNNTTWRQIQEGCPGASVAPSLLDRLKRLRSRA